MFFKYLIVHSIVLLPPPREMTAGHHWATHTALQFKGYEDYDLIIKIKKTE